jgi:deoxyribonuclease-4
LVKFVNLKHEKHMTKTTHHRQSAPKVLIGAHTSISGGLQNALYEGAAIGCTCIQIFTHSNRQWGMPPLKKADLQELNEARKKTGITQIMVHASYLINIASSNEMVRKRSITGLRDELLRCEELKIPLLVMHPGSAVGLSPKVGLENIVEAVNSILAIVPYRYTTLLFENMAGQGSSLGSTLEELAHLYNAIKHHNRVGFCIDTCHAFVAGYALDTEQGYKDFWHLFQKIIGLEHLKAIHMNDSQKDVGSRVDRHADIGKGKIGLEAFKRIMHDKRFAHIPKIIETPRTTLEDHARNLATLRSLINE